MTDTQTRTPTPVQELTLLLGESVKIATGNPEAQPRPGQLMCAKDIWQALSTRTRMNGIAPTGTGKSFAHMSCAALAAVLHEERTVISTNSLALQAQFMEKDLPVVAEAVKHLYDGYELRYAVLKGVSNYADPVRALDLARNLTGKTGERSFTALVKLLESGQFDKRWKPKNSGPQTSGAVKLAELAAWALGVYLDDSAHGDRESCPVEHTGDDWSLVSASSDEKAEEKDTGYVAKADEAKDRALEAHIVVTNHTLLGMQAAQRIPVVFGSKRLGRFDHLIVDEAHTLPGQVRSRGAAEVSGRQVIKAGRAVMNVIDDRFIDEDAQILAQDVDKAMQRAVATLPPKETALRVGGDEAGPVEDVLDQILQFTGRYLRQVKAAQESNKSNPVFTQKCRRATSALERLTNAANDATEPNPHIARWVTKQMDPKLPPVFESSPIFVGKLIENELWTVAPVIDMDSLEPEDDLEALLAMREPLGVACVSATLPSTFNLDVNIPSPPSEYASPFTEAYAGSAMFVPQCLAPADIESLKSSFGGYNGKVKFDTYRHEAWATGLIISLVRANGGRALVLSAKSASGKAYGKALDEALAGTEISVHTQWDGGQVSRIIDRWRSDETSVMVGTKSCMTGIDAKGETASLIIIDRPPRAAKNVIDEARLEDKMSSLGGNRWAADQQVYVSDAALLLDQAVGRAIRAESDRAMVAVLDPRLLTPKWSAFNYSTPVRQEFVKPLLRFGAKFNDLSAAVGWLEDRRSRVANG